METKKLSSNDIDIAARILKNGGLVAIPTETVYGLAANALESVAVQKIFAAKGRPSDNPLIVHISEFDEIHKLTSSLPESAKKLADAFWPGPLTIIVPKSEVIPDEVSAGLPSVAVRMPSHIVARKIIKACGFPLAAPSANLSGKPSPTCANHVSRDLYGKIDAILDGGTCSIGLESTVLNLCSDVPCILRPGAITKEDLKKVIPQVDIDSAVLSDVASDAIASSPGMKYKHYSPSSNVVLVLGSSEKYIQYIKENADNQSAALCFEKEKDNLGSIPRISYGHEFDYERQALVLFDALRRFDVLGVQTIFVHGCKPEGIGLAVYNRLIRAAGFEVVNLE